MKQCDFGHGTEKDSKNKLVQQYGMQKLWEQCAQTDFERWRRYLYIQMRKRTGAFFAGGSLLFWMGG